jgi:hypothetical protein
MDHVAFLKQELRQVGAILAGNASNKCGFHSFNELLGEIRPVWAGLTYYGYPAGGLPAPGATVPVNC